MNASACFFKFWAYLPEVPACGKFWTFSLSLFDLSCWFEGKNVIESEKIFQLLYLVSKLMDFVFKNCVLLCSVDGVFLIFFCLRVLKGRGVAVTAVAWRERKDKRAVNARLVQKMRLSKQVVAMMGCAEEKEVNWVSTVSLNLTRKRIFSRMCYVTNVFFKVVVFTLEKRKFFFFYCGSLTVVIKITSQRPHGFRQVCWTPRWTKFSSMKSFGDHVKPRRDGTSKETPITCV